MDAKHTPSLQAVVEELHRRLDANMRRKSDEESIFDRHLAQVPQITCADGLKLSVQASAFHYCAPRDSQGPWYLVEVGFPSRVVPEIAEWAEDPAQPTETVYGYTPIEKVAEAIVNAGGFEAVAA